MPLPKLLIGAETARAEASGGWVEDDLPLTLDAPVEAPVGFVEALPVNPEERPRKRRPKRDVVKIGWGSERLNRRTKR